MIGNINYMLFNVNTPDSIVDLQINETKHKVELSPVLGFHLNTEPIAVEYANVLSEIKAKIFPIKMGYQDYDKYFPAALASVKAAGLDKVVAEYQKQFTAWKATQK